MFKKVSQIVPILLILVSSTLVILPYFHPGFFPTHDGGWVPVRLSEMVRELKDLQIPPRISGFLNHDYGYPLFNFTYPFPYLLGSAIYFFGFGLVDTTKILFAVSVPLSGIFMFLLGKEFWKSQFAGLVSAILYIFLPYRIVDLYTRGSIGESLSLALFPIIFYLCLKRRSALLALSISILITTHNIMAILFLPAFLFFAWNTKRNVLIPLSLGLGLSAFFWLPAIFEKQYIYLSQTPIADRFLYFLSLKDLVIPKWGYGLPTNPDGFGYQLGLPHVLAFILVVILALFKKSKTTLLFALFTLCLVLLLFKISNPIWQLPLLHEINYPWTLLAPIGFLVSLLSGFLIRTKLTTILALIICVWGIAFCLPHALPSSYTYFPDDYYSTNDATTTSSDELMPLWVTVKPISKQPTTALVDSSNKIVFKVDSEKDSKVKINKIYYPGWTWSVPWKEKSGLMELSLKKGSYMVEGNFTETPLRQVANIISLISMTLLFVLLAAKLRSWRA